MPHRSAKASLKETNKIKPTNTYQFPFLIVSRIILDQNPQKWSEGEFLFDRSRHVLLQGDELIFIYFAPLTQSRMKLLRTCSYLPVISATVLTIPIKPLYSCSVSRATYCKVEMDSYTLQ